MENEQVPDQLEGLNPEELAPPAWVEGAVHRVAQMKRLLSDAVSRTPEGQEVFDRARDIMPDYDAALAKGELTVKDCVMLKRIAAMCLAVTLEG